jgi:hypothetical protein
MSEMVDRVKQAIMDDLRELGDADVKAGLGWLTDEQRNAVARAAITAMREPTDDMQLGIGTELDSHEIVRIWQHMIDRALG